MDDFTAGANEEPDAETGALSTELDQMSAGDGRDWFYGMISDLAPNPKPEVAAAEVLMILAPCHPVVR